MTHQEECAGFEAVTAILIEHGPAAMASAFGIIMNVAMQIEREQTLQAESHQRTADRQRYANGFTPKTIRTRVGEVKLSIRGVRSRPGPQWPKPTTEPAPKAGPAEAIVPLIYDRRVAGRKPRKTARKS